MLVVHYSIDDIPPNGSLHHIWIFGENIYGENIRWDPWHENHKHLEDIYLPTCITRSCFLQHALLSGAKQRLTRTGSNSPMVILASPGSTCLNSRSVLNLTLSQSTLKFHWSTHCTLKHNWKNLSWKCSTLECHWRISDYCSLQCNTTRWTLTAPTHPVTYSKAE